MAGYIKISKVRLVFFTKTGLLLFSVLEGLLKERIALKLAEDDYACLVGWLVIHFTFLGIL